MEFFKKISIALVVSISILALTIIGLIDLENNNKTRAVTIKSPEVITMDSRRISYQPILIAPYKDMDVFMSEEKSPGFEFTSVGGSWNEISAEGTNVEAEVKFKVDDVWTEWISMEEELDPKSGKKYAMASSDPATSIKYRFILYGDGKNSPVVKDIDWTFIKAAKKVSLESIEKPRYSSFVALAKDPTGVINRSNWGADESYRYLSDNNLDYPLAELDAEFYEKYFDELQYSRVVETDENGDKYKWPLQYPEKVKKVIIHHTATTKNLDNPAQAIRDIYHYHAVTRGWGDIGYNYLVDLEGNIYEGRYGGEGVIGAHSGPGNHGSIGVAILGNYQETPVPEEVLTKLSQFIYKKSKIHGIDTDAMSLFRGDLMYNIFGHKDIMSTACPGDYLYNKLPIIRGIAAQDTEQKEKFVKDYDYQNKSDLYYLELKPNENIDVTVKMENIGKIDWNEETFIVVDQNPAFDGVISFPTKVDATLAMMEETEVKPGETATFNFQIKAATTGETVYMNIAPLANGEKKINDYFVLPVAVQQPVYKYQFIEAKFPGNLMKTEEEFKAWVKLKNTGNVIWEDISLESENTSSIPKEGAVGQEEIATFEFTFSSPGKAGYFKESLIPTIDDINWTSSVPISFETIVYSKDYDAEILSKPFVNNWEQGKNYTLSLKFRNIGSENWEKSDFSSVFVKESALKISELNLDPSTVKPGETGTINFTVEVDEEAEEKNMFMLARPKIKNKPIFSKPVYLNYSVVEKQFQNLDQQEEIRIKLGFSGDPEITANGSYEVYAGETFLSTLSAGQITTVEKENGSYRVKTPNANFLKSEPIRFHPKNSAILKISNFENRPAWNESLNDNEYRGILEVIEDEESLIVINEIALEDYLKGLGEVSNSEEPEKIKAIMIAARTYAKYYMDIDEKFPGKPYNLDDDPNVSQKYIGYGFEKRAPNVAAGVDATKGKVVTHSSEVVKTPFFNQSDGVATKSAEEVWGWTHTPYLKSVSDLTCDGDQFLGHGVGLSGCGAKGMAQQGFDYEEILKHYYTGIEIADLY